MLSDIPLENRAPQMNVLEIDIEKGVKVEKRRRTSRNEREFKLANRRRGHHRE